MVTEAVVPRSWAEITDALFADSWNPSLNRFRSPFAFRGLSDAKYALQTRLMRLSGDYARVEDDLLRNFRKYAHREFSSEDVIWNWLALAQHHGLPTRLLDWTYSPYVALHFATANIERFDVDGVVWCLNFVESNRRLPRKLRDVLVEEGSDVFTTEMLARTTKSIAEFDGLSREPFLVFLEPPSLDDRIVNQAALFTIMSNPHVRLDDWLSQHPTLVRKMIVPARLKWEVRDKLNQANLTERVLFPGLDGLSDWLKRYYMQRDL